MSLINQPYPTGVICNDCIKNGVCKYSDLLFKVKVNIECEEIKETPIKMDISCDEYLIKSNKTQR